jgi:glycine/D-amino acid oxidase-like deaminating enzyme
LALLAKVDGSVAQSPDRSSIPACMGCAGCYAGHSDGHDGSPRAGQRGDRILIRSRYTYNSRQIVREGALKRAGAQHDRKFKARFPGLGNVDMQYRWAGGMALTVNAVPAFGEVEHGVFAACGCNGLGASKATASGIAAAEMMLGCSSEITRIYQRFQAPKALPPRPLIAIGAKANLAFREWNAGAE